MIGPDPSATSGNGPLADLRVVEVAGWMAAPGCGAMLADMGAEVIKIEPLRGDAARNMVRPARRPPDGTPLDASFQADNRGKRSVAIALDTESGAVLARRLAGTANVFLSNLLPRRQARYGLDPDTLLALRSDLVHATLTGYGLTGPDAERPGFDVTTFFGRGAITDSLTEPDGSAPAPRPAQGDHTTSLALFGAILAALRLAERTGQGQVVDVSLLGTATWTMMSDLAAPLADGRPPTRRRREERTAPLTQNYRCRDGRWIILNMPEERFWEPFCRAVGLESLLEDSRYGSPRARYDHMGALTAAMDQAFATRSLAEWGTILDEAGLIWGPAATLIELTQDDQAHAIGRFPEVMHPEVGSFRTVAAPMTIAGAEIRPRGPAPEIGQHTEAILGELGLDAPAIAELRSRRIIG